MSSENLRNTDPIAETLHRYAQNILVAVFGLLPIFFIPSTLAPFEYSKIFFVIIGTVAALILYSLSVLRSGKITLSLSYTLGTIWVVALVACISALLSGDIKDSLVGDLFSVHSAVFVAILALTMSVWALIGVSRISVIRLYMLLAGSTVVLVLFHVARLIIGADTLSLGIFSSAISTPVGSWNDLALFLGLSVLLSLVAMEQLPLTKHGRFLFGGVTVAALFMLGVINFFTVWLILGLVSLVMVVYSLGKDKFSGSQLTLVGSRSTNASSLLLSLVVFTVSTLFVIGGAAFGGAIAKYTNISYIEVRPSLEATADIARNVYQDNALLGVGPNKFIDAWRLYKDASINQTIFWNTDFNAGNGYLSTFFITTGVLGGLAWLIFLGTYAIAGARLLLTVSDADRMWYFIGVSSFVSAIYIWGMTLMYVPGAVVLILGALCTGVSLAAAGALHGRNVRTISVVTNRRTGFVFTLAVIAVIISSIGVLYASGKDYASVYAFNESARILQDAQNPIDVVDVAEAKIASAYELSPNDVYARRLSEYEFERLKMLLAIQTPTEADRALFERVMLNAINAAEQAKQADSTESQNWAVQGSIYSLLMSVNYEGVYDRALEALSKARDFNPKNPIPYLALAELEGRAGNFDAARGYAETAVSLRPNFTDAFFYLSQLDIVTGNVEGAIKSTLAIIALEPQNAARYYQLGVLETSRKNIDGAILAFERAVGLDTNYANARYLLALAYDAKGRAADAKVQLEKVLELNPGNTEVTQILSTLETNGTLMQTATGTSPARIVEESATVSDDNGTVSTNEAPDSSLVSPVNTAPKPQEETGASVETTEPTDSIE
jgi:tetratricopeptide (TPR) repeat protein